MQNLRRPCRRPGGRKERHAERLGVGVETIT